MIDSIKSIKKSYQRQQIFIDKVTEVYYNVTMDNKTATKTGGNENDNYRIQGNAHQWDFRLSDKGAVYIRRTETEADKNT